MIQQGNTNQTGATSQNGPTVVIGAGLIGVMCAYYLQKTGHEVVLLDAGKLGNACSHANCGYICPSHVLPLPGPGVIPRTLKAMLSPHSAFSIKPRLSPELWRWLFNFAWRCRTTPMHETAITRHQMLQSSVQLFDKLLTTENIQCQQQNRGLLFVFQSKKELEHFDHTQEWLTQEFAVEASRYDEKQLQQIEPALKDGLAGAWHYHQDRHLRPDLLLSEMRQRLEANGVTIIEDFSVDRFLTERGKVKAAHCSKRNEDIAGSKFVVATGAMTPWLNQILGIKIPIQPGKGYSITTNLTEGLPTHPMILEEHHVAITPLGDRFRIGSTMEFAGYDRTISEPRLKLLREGANHYLHHSSGDEVIETWYGWRPMTWDGKPFIDPCPTLGNVWVAAGHNMLGLSMCTVTGKLIQELLDGEPTHLNTRPLSLDRIHKW